jgi:hypothetical protein
MLSGWSWVSDNKLETPYGEDKVLMVENVCFEPGVLRFKRFVYDPGSGSSDGSQQLPGYVEEETVSLEWIETECPQ